MSGGKVSGGKMSGGKVSYIQLEALIYMAEMSIYFLTAPIFIELYLFM